MCQFNLLKEQDILAILEVFDKATDLHGDAEAARAQHAPQKKKNKTKVVSLQGDAPLLATPHGSSVHAEPAGATSFRGPRGSRGDNMLTHPGAPPASASSVSTLRASAGHCDALVPALSSAPLAAAVAGHAGDLPLAAAVAAGSTDAAPAPAFWDLPGGRHLVSRAQVKRSSSRPLTWLGAVFTEEEMTAAREHFEGNRK